MSSCDRCKKDLKPEDVKMSFPEGFGITGRTLREATSLSFRGEVLCTDCFQEILDGKEQP